jgi:hypothetical protein
MTIAAFLERAVSWPGLRPMSCPLVHASAILLPPIAPDIRGDYGEMLYMPEGTDAWQQKLITLIGNLTK